MEIKFLSKKELNERLDQFCDLSRQCFTAHVDEEIIYHRYIENPYEDLLMCVAEENGKIVANYSVVPVRAEIDGEKYKAALSLNTMTHPEYEGRGLLIKLAGLLYEHMEKENYAFVYGFPNYLSNGILCAKLGWKDVYEIPTLELRVKDNKRIPEIKESFESSWNGLLANNSRNICVCKEEQYLNWRYRKHKTNHYQMLRLSEHNWCIYHVFGTEINMTEFHYENLDVLKQIISQIYHVACDNKLEKITVWSPTNTDEHFLFERYGFSNTRPIRYFGVKKLAYEGTADIYDSRNWRIFMGDDNVY